jgi:acyl-CoA thioester hydrolase
MGIVHHAAYLTYVEAARVEYLKRRGADYRELMRGGHHMPVVEAHLRYHRTARFDDELVVNVRLGLLSRVTIRFDYRIIRAGELIADGYTLLACVDDSHRPRRIPAEIVAMLKAPER